MSPSRAEVRSVILYELNEVPWRVVDLYTAERRSSTLASVIASGLSLTTENHDPVPLQPWRTWPTFHASMYTGDHNSFDLGQDPSTFRGIPLWDVVEAAGLPVGLFGPLQSWPSRAFEHGGFFVPDTFSRTPDTFPEELGRFQRFNTTMTRENTFSPEADPARFEMLSTGLDLLRRGITPSSVLMLGSQLVKERRDGRYRARRSIMQAVPGFDLYWRLHLRTAPRLSIFFTNHVAGMMHRYWGDWVTDYAQVEDYAPDPVFSGFVPTAMDVVDRHLRRIKKYVDDHPGTVLVVAASMGQGPIPYRHLDETFVLDAPERLLDVLRLGKADVGLAMYPRVSLGFEDEEAARDSVAPLQSVEGRGCGPVFRDFTVNGCTVSFEINFDHVGAGAEEQLTVAPAGGGPGTTTPRLLGIALRPRTGGGNTAYHVPEGMLLAYGTGIDPGGDRAPVDILDVAPSLLANVLEIEPAPTMQGKPSLFQRASPSA